MIAFVRGRFVAKTPSQVVVDVNGVGYELQISLNTFSSINDKQEGQLHTYLHITENGQTLFGFFEVVEKELFQQLISVSGVGAGTARIMLSGMRPHELAQAIVESNTKLLEGIKGIGRKTAERIVLELKEKLTKTSAINEKSVPLQNTAEQDALNALVALGINRNTAEVALKKVIQTNSSLSIENIIKQALKNL